MFRTDPSRLLLSLGSSVALLDNNRNTALHWAVEARNAVAISMLLDKNTPLDVANDKVISLSAKNYFRHKL